MGVDGNRINDGEAVLVIPLGDIVSLLDIFSRAVSSTGRLRTWLRCRSLSRSGPRLDSVIALPVAVTAEGGNLYIRLYLLGRNRLFGSGTIGVRPRIEAVVLPNAPSGLQVRTREALNAEEMLLPARGTDPCYRVVLPLPGADDEWVSRQARSSPHSMGVLFLGHIDITRKRRTYEARVVPLSLSLGNEVLLEHQGPLLPAQDGEEPL